jgi:heme exporter protein CcmD
MIAAGTDLQFVWAAYIGVAVVTLALIAWVVLESRGTKARLKALEDSGIRRGAAGKSA